MIQKSPGVFEPFALFGAVMELTLLGLAHAYVLWRAPRHASSDPPAPTRGPKPPRSSLYVLLLTQE